MGLYTRVQNLNNPTLKQLGIQVNEYLDNDGIESLIIGINLSGKIIEDSWVGNNDGSKIHISAVLARNGSDSLTLKNWPVAGECKDKEISTHAGIYMYAISGNLRTSLNFNETKPFYGITNTDTFSVALTNRIGKWVGQDWFYIKDMPSYPGSGKLIKKIMWLDYTGESLFKDKNDKSPYYNFWIGLQCPKLLPSQETDLKHTNIGIVLEFSSRDSLGGFENPITVENIFPEPSVFTPTKIAYLGYDKVKQVLDNTGIRISGIDINAKSKSDKTIFLYTVLIGTLLAFMLDILVELVIKWRNLVKRSRKLKR